jgi:hypothetical protein
MELVSPEPTGVPLMERTLPSHSIHGITPQLIE